MKVFIFDLDRCNGCHNCQIACKDEHVDNDWSPIARPQPDTGQFWCKVEGPDGYRYEPVWLNPVDAGKLGLQDGDVVRVYNERGAVLGGVIVSERIMPGAVYQDHGARVDPVVVGERGLDRGGANNLICPTATTSKNAVGEATNGYLVNVEKVDVFELARRYPEAFGRDYDPADGLRVSAWMAEGE